MYQLWVNFARTDLHCERLYSCLDVLQQVARYSYDLGDAFVGLMEKNAVIGRAELGLDQSVETC